MGPSRCTITSFHGFDSGALNEDDKNSLLDGLNIRKTELYVKQKGHKIWGGFLGRPGGSLAKSFNLLKSCNF
jgi:hypothetical protein